MEKLQNSVRKPAVKSSSKGFNRRPDIPSESTTCHNSASKFASAKKFEEIGLKVLPTALTHFGEKLHQDAMNRLETKEKEFQMEMKRKGDEEMKPCTFSPKVLRPTQVKK